MFIIYAKLDIAAYALLSIRIIFSQRKGGDRLEFDTF
jgi:hypothetical protein